MSLFAHVYNTSIQVAPTPPPPHWSWTFSSSLLAYESQASRKEHTLRNQNAYCKINFHHLRNIEIEVQTLLRILCAGAVISIVSFLDLFEPIPRVTYPTTWHFYHKLKRGADIYCTNFENPKLFFSFCLSIHTACSSPTKAPVPKEMQLFPTLQLVSQLSILHVFHLQNSIQIMNVCECNGTNIFMRWKMEMFHSLWQYLFVSLHEWENIKFYI